MKTEEEKSFDMYFDQYLREHPLNGSAANDERLARLQAATDYAKMKMSAENLCK
jgi:hypothetical protein